MQNNNPDDTQPTKVGAGAKFARKQEQQSQSSPPPDKNTLSEGVKPDQTQPIRALKAASKPSRSQRWLWAALIAACLSLSIVTGGLAGFRSAQQQHISLENSQEQSSLKEQYQLALQDQTAGDFNVARQRLEYILTQDPGYPGATEKMAEIMAILYATSTPTQLPPSATPSPTPDLRPVQELFTQAQELFSASDWNKTIDTLLALRQSDPTYQVTRVDGMLYLALRNRGIRKITVEANLEGGIYDLALAERFGPLDVEANAPREWARLYMIGLSFWEVDPKQAAYYFGQVAAAAPGLRDASGLTASERYFEALVQYGDLLTNQKDWCEAARQYELALTMRADTALQEKFKNAADQCLGVTPTGSATVVITPGETPTIQPPWVSETPTLGVPPTDTLAPPVDTPVPPSPTNPPPVASDTPTPTLEIPPTDTQAPPLPEPSATSGARTQPGSAANVAPSISLGALLITLLAGVLVKTWLNLFWGIK